MADDPVDIVTDEVDKISGLPDDVLLDILGRLAMARDVHTDLHPLAAVEVPA